MTNPVKQAAIAGVVVIVASVLIWAMMPDLPAVLNQMWMPLTVLFTAIAVVGVLSN